MGTVRWGYPLNKRQLARIRLERLGYRPSEIDEFEAIAEDRDYDAMCDKQMEDAYRDIWSAAKGESK